MDDPSSLELEGRLHGQHVVLALIIAHLLEQPDSDLRQKLESRQVVSDHQEDPGAVADPAFAYEAAAAQEIGRLLERAEALRKEV